MNNNIRVVKDRALTAFAFFCGLAVLGILVLGIVLVTRKGIGAVSFRFLTSTMSEGGVSGGIFYQIIGTMISIAAAFVLVIPFAVGVALLKEFYLRHLVWKKTLTFFLYTLNGIPSIIFGIFGFFFFVKYLGWGKSWLAGAILLAMMILPTCTLALAEGIRRIPREYIENAKSLGLSDSAIVYLVLLPQSFSSFLSGIFLGLARACGEIAPLMFAATIFSGATLPTGIKENPVLSLPYHIFNLVQESYQPQALEHAWGSVLVLIMIVFILSLCALPFRLHAHEEAEVF